MGTDTFAVWDDHVERMAGVAGFYGGLRGETRFDRLVAVGADAAREACAFARAVTVSLQRGMLSTEHSAPMQHAQSDALRRQLFARPVAVRPGTQEHAMLAGRNAPALLAVPSPKRSSSSTSCSFRSPSACVGLLLFERPAEPVTAADRVAARAYGAMLGAALDPATGDARLREFAQEVRGLAALAGALSDEALLDDFELSRPGRRLPCSSSPAEDITD